MSNMYSLFTSVLVLTLTVACAASPDVLGTGSLGESVDTGVQYQTSFSGSVTYKELRQWSSQIRDRPLLAAQELHFGIVPVKTRLSRFITVHNPTDRPMMVQLLLLPNDIEEVLRYGCAKKVVSFVETPLDEEEFDLHEGFPVRCSSDNEEIEAVKDISAQPPPFFPRFTSNMSMLEKMRQIAIYCENRSLKKEKQSSRLNLLPRYKCGRKCSWVLPDSETNMYMLQGQSQGFFLTNKGRGVVVIQPDSTAAVGPIIFQGQAVGTFQGRAMIRTNATLYEVIEMSAEAKYARIAFRKEIFYRQATKQHKLSVFTHSQEMQSLTFDITEEDIESQFVTAKGMVRLPETVKVMKIYEAENVGTLPLLISGFLINGYSCSLMGISIENCGKAYILQPHETIEVVVSYEVTFLQRELQVHLWVITDEDSFYLPLEVTLHIDNITKYSGMQTTDIDSMSYFLSELCILVNIVITSGYVVALFQEVVAEKGPRGGRCRVVSTRTRTNMETFKLFTRLQAPVLNRKPVCLREEPIPEPQPAPILEEEDEEDSKPPLEAQKQKKIKKMKRSILKFAPSNDSPKSDKSGSQVVFATNKLLLAKKKQKRVDSGESVPCVCDLESEKPGGGKEVNFESRTTTHSEDGEGEDEYLDQYKMRKGLFSGFSRASS